jgi:stalled ribosome alternative rescue factor ArfA
MTQTRGTMPQPTRADKAKKGKGSYNRKEGKRVDYK